MPSGSSPPAGARDERSAAGTPFRLRLVAHDPEAYRLFYGVVANPVLWFVQHGLWDLKRDPDADLTVPWRDGYAAANRAIAEAAVAELDRVPGAALYVHDYHLYLVPSLVARAAPGRAHRVLRPHPVGRPRRLGGAARARSPGRSTRVSSRATASVSTPSSGGRRSSRPARPSSVAGRTRSASRMRTRSPSTPSEFDTLAASEAVRARRAELQEDRPGDPRRARRPHGSRRRTPSAGSRRSVGCSSATRAPRPRRPPRAARPVAAGDSRVRGLPRRDRARRRGGERAVRARRAGSPSGSRSETTSPRRSPRTRSTTCSSSTP